jgi:hypothetical protein
MGAVGGGELLQCSVLNTTNHSIANNIRAAS